MKCRKLQQSERGENKLQPLLVFKIVLMQFIAYQGIGLTLNIIM